MANWGYIKWCNFIHVHTHRINTNTADTSTRLHRTVHVPLTTTCKYNESSSEDCYFIFVQQRWLPWTSKTWCPSDPLVKSLESAYRKCNITTIATYCIRYMYTFYCMDQKLFRFHLFYTLYMYIMYKWTGNSAAMDYDWYKLYSRTSHTSKDKSPKTKPLFAIRRQTFEQKRNCYLLGFISC